MGDGKVMIIKPDGTEEIRDTGYPEMRDLQKMVGGHVVKLTCFPWVGIEGEPFECAAFCCEDGLLMQMAKNQKATERYYVAAKSADFLGPQGEIEFLVGDVAVFYGDAKLVRKLQKNW